MAFINDQSMSNPSAGPGFDLSALQAHQAQSHAHAAQHNSSGRPAMDTTAAAALNYSMTIPPHPAQEFLNQPTAGTENTPSGLAVSDFQGMASPTRPETSNIAGQTTPPHGGDPNASGGSPPSDTGNTPGGPSSSSKPEVGSQQWHKVRKDNHKEVERRRRETINEGINELAKIVPGCEKNKGSILARAVQYIQKLQDDATSNIDKWTFEKLVTEQAIGDLSGKLDRAHALNVALKREAAQAGVDVERVEVELSDDAGDSQQQTGGNGGATSVSGAQRTQAQHPQHSRVSTANMSHPQAQGDAESTSESADGKLV